MRLRKGGDFRGGFQIPKPDGLEIAKAGEGSSLRGVGHPVDILKVPPQHGLFFSRCRIPEADGGIKAAARQLFGIGGKTRAC